MTLETEVAVMRVIGCKAGTKLKYHIESENCLLLCLSGGFRSNIHSSILLFDLGTNKQR